MNPNLAKAFYGLLLTCMVLVSAQDDYVHEALQHWKGSPPRVLAAYMPWFGNSKHIDVGYSSHDPDVLRRQIDEATRMGISGFTMDWYGPAREYDERTLELMVQAAHEKNFQIALLYNESDNQGQSTDLAISDLDYAFKKYMGPEARYPDAYLTYNGRPVIFIFPKGGRSDWNRVRQHVNGWSTPPVLIYKDSNAQYAEAFDGFFVWIHPGKKGWQANGSDWGKDHLEDFYKKMKNKHPDKMVVAGAWAGFDDSRAKWGLNRHMDPRCGKTLQDTLRMAEQFSGPNPVPFLLLETWNDYEEGTALERRVLSNCGDD
ncbi:MAG TPA: hypothetical protein VGF06_11955 [Terriglobales bacterium]